MARFRLVSLMLAAVMLIATACASDSETVVSAEPTDGIRIVTPEDGAELQSNPDVVVLDVRTPEEFADGHLDGALMIDFYEPDFADRIAELDPEATYLIYCRSGNRSSQARATMESLGFGDVADIDGGIVAWSDAGLPLTR